MNTQTCSKCGITKPIEEFWKSLTGRESTCKQCRMIHRYEQRLEKRKKEGLKTLDLTTRQRRELANIGLKYCPRCKDALPIQEFSTMVVGTKIASHCRNCSAELLYIYNQTEKAKAKRKEYYSKYRRTQRNNKLFSSFGITIEQYDAIYNQQKGKCKICGKTKEKNGKDLAVDHDHRTGKVRSLLCSKCNAGIGFFDDDQQKLKKAALYFDSINKGAQ